MVIRDPNSGIEGFPLRQWSVEIHLLNDHGEPVPASVFPKVTYHLHPSFEQRATQSTLRHTYYLSMTPTLQNWLLTTLAIKSPPFRIEEEGWGEFDMQIVLSAPDKDHSITHDLNFQSSKYESKHVIVCITTRFIRHKYSPINPNLGGQTFKNPKPPLLAQLRESGPVPGDENGVKKRGQEESKKKKRADKNVDMDKLADGLQKLGEDDLLQVVQMVHDNKSSDSYTKNDIERKDMTFSALRSSWVYLS
ncbi:hypothetical protein H112_02556 [Trichophyton rubrum D6]|uniref:YEATS domain-containing protein n=3 Tax=Trichophyton TaxID=5550 RepID=A0A080WW14_TRIRC|nr:uncharacterized protein TERG_06318 [Trichophyton rubrum CBS 118892]EZF25058.1 hypothetical protein H100_02562 [Trichophyton rubrum MR850]EZF44095.1 hypothetical protein H102_02552 [Trichophyton rubrum CBS 100081]EZF54743.1 hypothetical protein H103_02568 [Trichophyton rubrum CBS 288.86]EZF65358.1 hypothetical protein H104_02544 [Trichophyton rubrum CBS 289.86]EZF75996.1 hypothetical protein H105_02571 [Trichophyton soudanense CBS 452.61]EZF86655.1 hypothetical protein H110_02561 [Trichophy